MQNKILIWGQPNSISIIKKTLENDDVCAGTADTVLGLLANTTQKGFEKLNEIKKRSEKSYIVLIGSFDKLNHFIDIDHIDQKLIKLIKKNWPGPLTIVFKSKRNLPDYLKSFNDSIAIRIPSHAGLLQLLTFFEGLFSTSANLSGHKIPESLDELDFHIVNSVDHIILDNYEKNYRYPVLPSTILDCTNSNIKVIRQGAISIQKLEEDYGETFQK